MRIGITGHQARPEIDWEWVHATLNTEIATLEGVQVALSSLAIGSDQVFAEVCLALTIPVTAVIPLADYDSYFQGESLNTYQNLLASSSVIQLDGNRDDAEEAFLQAGLFIVENAELLFAVWDGKTSRGKGGTSDIVDHAFKVGRAVTWLNPTEKSVTHREQS